MKKLFYFLLFSLFTIPVFSQDEMPDVEIPRFTVEYEAVRSLAQTLDYWHSFMETDMAWNRNTGEWAVVYVVDTGQNPHEDISSFGLQYGFNTTPEPMADGNGHGTYCAGVIAALRNNIGALGVAPGATVVPAKGMRNNGTGSSTEIAAAIVKSADVHTQYFPDKIGIISMSFGGGSPMPDVEQALLYAISKGMVLVASAGNSGYSGSGNTIGWPARYPFVISVASIGKPLANGTFPSSPFSSGGEGLTCTAFGEQIYTTSNQNGYGRVSGTSFSGPMVAGVCALIGTYHRQSLLSGDRTKINDRVHEHIRKYATDLPPAGADTRTGYGLPKATILDKPIQGGVVVPDPPIRAARNINVKVKGVYSMLWRPENASEFQTLNVEFEVKHLSRQSALKAHQDATNWIATFFNQRGFILLPNDDEWEALFWCRHFTEMISKAQGVTLTCMKITGTTAGGVTFTLSDTDRRAGATARAKAGVQAGVSMTMLSGE